jgi:hypothetical protein
LSAWPVGASLTERKGPPWGAAGAACGPVPASDQTRPWRTQRRSSSCIFCRRSAIAPPVAAWFCSLERCIHDFRGEEFFCHERPFDRSSLTRSRSSRFLPLMRKLLLEARTRITFTHDVEMPALLPGVPPTGRRVELPHVVVMGVVEGKISYEHIYWDQASLLVQVGLLDPSKLPVTAAEQTHKVIDPTLPSNELIRRANLRASA